jgi:hypothetical protein
LCKTTAAWRQPLSLRRRCLPQRHGACSLRLSGIVDEALAAVANLVVDAAGGSRCGGGGGIGGGGSLRCGFEAVESRSIEESKNLRSPTANSRSDGPQRRLKPRRRPTATTEATTAAILPRLAWCWSRASRLMFILHGAIGAIKAPPVTRPPRLVPLRCLMALILQSTIDAISASPSFLYIKAKDEGILVRVSGRPPSSKNGTVIFL